MRTTNVLWTGAVVVATAVASTTDMYLDGIVTFDLRRIETREWSSSELPQYPLPPLLSRRADSSDTFTETVANELLHGGYFIDTVIGDPGQEVTLLLDTGSSHTWVPSSESEVCISKGCEFGSYTPEESSTFHLIENGTFEIAYLDTSHAVGDLFSDTLEIGGGSVENFTMGLGKKDTNIPYGLVGVGFAVDDPESELRNVNLPLAMVEAGLINTNAYSLWLNDLDATTGHIMFGGIDTEKYVGEMTRIPLHPDPWTGNITSFTIALTSLTASSPTGTDNFRWHNEPVYVILDSGATLSYLPTDIAEQLWTEAGAVYDSRPWISMPLIPCDRASSAGYFTFGFAGHDGPRINITMDELVLDVGLPTGRFDFAGVEYMSEDVCMFGIQNMSGDPFLLGDTFLRSAYVVYDLVNREVGIAATDFNATESNLVPFPSQGAAIPSATYVVSFEEATEVGWLSDPTSQSFSAAEGFSTMVSGGPLLEAPEWMAAVVIGACFLAGGSIVVM